MTLNCFFSSSINYIYFDKIHINMLVVVLNRCCDRDVFQKGVPSTINQLCIIGFPVLGYGSFPRRKTCLCVQIP